MKVLDTSVENFASGAWQALGSAWRGGSNLVHKYDSVSSHLCKMCSFLLTIGSESNVQRGIREGNLDG